MSATYIEFARGLELVCRHLNPPQWPLRATIRLSELDLDGAQLTGDDPRLAYRYVGGLELPAIDESPLRSKPIWASERGLISLPTSAIEIEPGMLAIGDGAGVVRVFVRAGRGRWESAAALLSHSAAVRDICPLKGGGFATVGDDGQIAIHKRDANGVWHFTYPGFTPARGAAFSTAPYPLNAVCQIADDRLIAAGGSGVMAELQMLPSGDWEASQTSFPGSGGDTIALAAYGQNQFCAVLRGGSLLFCTRFANGTISSLPAAVGFGEVQDVAAWGERLIACTDAGEMVLFDVAAGTTEQRPLVERIASIAIRKVRVLDRERIATWSIDQQMRIWSYESGRFVLRASLPAAGLSDPCLAPLSDGRVGFIDTRGFAIAMPQLDGTWRSEEIASPYEVGLSLIAALSPGSVACLEGEALRVVSLSASGIAVADVPIGYTVVSSLAGFAANTLLIGSRDGKLRIARENDNAWTVTDLPSTHSATIDRLASAGPYFASGDANGLVNIWEFKDGKFLLLKTLNLPAPLSVLAIDDQGRLAASSHGTPLSVTNFQSDTSTTVPPAVSPIGLITALAWDNATLLALTENGEIRRIRFEPNPQIEMVRPPGNRLTPACFAVLRKHNGSEIAYARGTLPIEIGTPGLLVYAHHAEIRMLAAAGETLYAGGDALYVFDTSTMPVKTRRIVINEQVILESRQSSYGDVQSTGIRRRDGSPWMAATVGGRAVPNDPLLHAHLAVIEPNGQLGEVFTSTNFFFSSDRRELRIEDPNVPPG